LSIITKATIICLEGPDFLLTEKERGNMNRAILKLFILGSLVLFCAGTAGAVHDLFNKMDENNDRKVTREEFTRDMEKDAFDRLDVNKDGILTPEEWEKTDFISESDRQQEVFRHVDRDANKRISFPEFSDYAYKYSNIEEAFMIMDKDRDGSLSPDEVTLRPLFRLITIRY
jgi:Ca2+-binding EF-hand superfamily protein